MSTPTKTALTEMLTESTGTHFLDSGGDDGRHWQRNQGRDFEHEKPSIVSFRYDTISLTHRLYFWLSDRLDIDEEANAAFEIFRDQVDADNARSWGELRDLFPGWFARHCSLVDSEESCTSCDGVSDDCDDCDGSGAWTRDDLYSATGIYGEGEPVTVNSYNEPALLEQTILFTYFELRAGPGRAGNQGSFVVLQIHGGADVRGGYTRPRIFRLKDPDDLAIFDVCRGTIVCEGDPSHEWTTDDGCHWYRDGAAGLGALAQLETYDRATVDDEAAPMEPGKLHVTETGRGFCPLCNAPLRGAS